MHNLLKVVFLAIALLNYVSSEENIEDDDEEQAALSQLFFRRWLSNGKRTCRYNSDCDGYEYCLKGKTWGYCELKGEDGVSCMYDHRCLSGHCHGFKCKGQQKGADVFPNGRCDSDNECRYEQYCKKKKCADRKKEGSCSEDSECISNHCSWYKCVVKTYTNSIETEVQVN